MIKEIIEEILQASEDSFVTIAKDDYISYMKELRQNLSSFFICQENNENLLRFHFL